MAKIECLNRDAEFTTCTECGEVSVVDSRTHICSLCGPEGLAFSNRAPDFSIDTKMLQKIVMGSAYDERIIKQAIDLADGIEVKLCLMALRSGRGTFYSQMVLQDFVCRLESRINNCHSQPSCT